MKKVFTTSSDVIHLFAQRSQSEARCSNVYFYDIDKIYSYGRHYLLGEFINNSKNDIAIMINDTGYSATTANHISEIKQATRQYQQFFVTETNVKSVLATIESNAKKLQNARKPELYILPSQRLFDRLNAYITWTGNKATKKDPDYKNIVALMQVIDGKADYFTTYLRKNADRIKRDELKRKKLQAAKLLTDIQKFEQHEINSFNSDQDFVRLSTDQEFVETSQSVKVTVKEAKILYNMIVAGKDIKGFRISNYTVISINGTLKIGCHNINIESMHKTGSKLLEL